MKIIGIVVVCFFVTGFSAYAQNFGWKAELDSVKTKGFYDILLTPDINSGLKSDYSDIRLFDQNNKEIPYLIRHEVPKTNKDYLEIPDLTITQVDSNEVKKTFIKISFNSTQYIDKLEFDIKGPAYYLRDAVISERITDSESKWDGSVYYEPLEDLEFMSNDSNIVYLSKLRGNEFYLIIENEDNQPLQIRSVKAFQSKSYLTAYLETGEKYTLKFGDENLSEPVYDLRYFENAIPSKIPVLETGEVIQLLKKEKSTVEEKPTLFSNKTILWAVIGFVVALLSILSIKMVQDMKRKEKP